MVEISLQIIILLALIAFNGLLALSELAVVSSRATRLQQQAESGSPGAKAAIALMREPTRFLSTVQIGITLVGILAGAFGGASLASSLATALEDAGMDEGIAGTLSVVIVVAAITYLSLIFGELVPKRVAMNSPERIAALVARPMQVLSRISAPFVTILSLSTGSVLKLLGLGREKANSISEEEIRLMIGMSAESGSVDEEEAELLDRIFHFGDRRVHEVMVPRTEVVWIEHTNTVGDFFRVYAERPHSRFPVYLDTTDNIIGILGIKRVLQEIALHGSEDDRALNDLWHSPMFIPETKLIGELFREMQDRGEQMAIAVDEFGGTAGIVTLEQLTEEILGPMHDEMRPDDVEIVEIDDRTSEVDGGLSVEEAREELGIEIPEGPYDTIAGYVLERLGHVPQEGEILMLHEHRITITQMKGPKIERLRVVRL